MATITSRKLDSISKLEIVYFADKFGAQSQVQHPLSRTRLERDADEAAHLALLTSNEAAFEALVEEGGQ